MRCKIYLDMGRGLRKATADKTQVICTPAGKNALMEWIVKNPMRPQQGQVVGAVLEWFCRQEPIVTSAITGNIDKGMEKAYADALRALAAEIEGLVPGALKIAARPRHSKNQEDQ